MPYFYEKQYTRKDGTIYVKKFSRSFERGVKKEVDPDVEKVPGNSNSVEASASRARSTVRILAFSNPDLIGMLTLTNADIPTEEEAQKRFKVFLQKVKRRGYTDFKFLGVKELQKRGSIHWHLLVNYCPNEMPSPNNPNKFVTDLWDFGYSDYQVIKGDDLWRTELYLLKYMTKEHLKLFSQWYVRSRKLDQIQPEYFHYKRKVPKNASNVYVTHIENKNVDSFDVTEYTLGVT